MNGVDFVTLSQVEFMNWKTNPIGRSRPKPVRCLQCLMSKRFVSNYQVHNDTKADLFFPPFAPPIVALNSYKWRRLHLIIFAIIFRCLVYPRSRLNQISQRCPRQSLGLRVKINLAARKTGRTAAVQTC